MGSSEEVKQEIAAVLRTVYGEAYERASKIDPSFAALIKEMEVFILRGGKRMRPYLAQIAYQGLGGTNDEVIFRAGAALEMLHNFLLIHDDIIDRDLVRYGGANLEGTYLSIFREQNARDPEHSALAASLLAGDVTVALCKDMIYTLPIAAEQRLAVARAVDDAVFIVGGGEFVDSLASSLSHELLSEQQIESMYIHKTSLYSFYLPLEIGALLAGAPATVLEQLRAFAIPLGVAFQIRDDYLGLFGDPSVTGKPITSDVREGKQTLLFAMLREKLSPQEREDLAIHYGNPHAEEAAVHWVRALCEEKGVVEDVEVRVQELHDEALNQLEMLPCTDEAKRALREVVAFCTERHG